MWGKGVGALLDRGVQPGRTRSARMRAEEASMELRTVKAVVTGGASGLGRAAAERLLTPGGYGAPLDRPRAPRPPARLATGGASAPLPRRPASPGAEAAKAMGERAIFTPADVTVAAEVSV